MMTAMLLVDVECSDVRRKLTGPASTASTRASSAVRTEQSATDWLLLRCQHALVEVHVEDWRLFVRLPPSSGRPSSVELVAQSAWIPHSASELSLRRPGGQADGVRLPSATTGSRSSMPAFYRRHSMHPPTFSVIGREHVYAVQNHQVRRENSLFQ